MFGWTYEECASHNRFQIEHALIGYEPDVLTFSTEKELQEYMRKQNK